MKFKEILTLTRPATTVPFYPEGAIHASKSESGLDFVNTDAYEHYVVAYVDTGKCDLTVPSLSEDGLVLTYTTIYASEDAVVEMQMDPFYTSTGETRLKYWVENDILIETDIAPITV